MSISQNYRMDDGYLLEGKYDKEHRAKLMTEDRLVSRIDDVSSYICSFRCYCSYLYLFL